MTNTIILSLQQVSLGYGSHTVLSDVNLTVHTGERILITGVNGSGKSTLLKLISGNLIHRTGSVQILGTQMVRDSDRQYIRKRIGVLTQVQQDPELAITVQESVLLGLWGTRFSWLGRPKRIDHEKALERLDSVDMADFATRDIRTLSGGQRQKVALARALIRDPQLVLMDEPTTYLDTEAKRDIIDRIDRLQRELGFTSLVVSHESLDDRLSDRHIHIEAGTLICDRGETA